MNNYSQKVFYGDQLINRCDYNEENIKFYMMGTDKENNPIRIPVGEHLLSRHMLLLGGIGTGKSNAFNFLIRNVRHSLKENDVLIIFDTKGDYYKEFYREGDIVISNDDTSRGEQGIDYWNLFKEIEIDDRVEENIIEISNGFFTEAIRNTTQTFFPNAAKDIFSAILLHLVRSEEHKEFKNNESLKHILDTFSVVSMKKILNSHDDLKAMVSYIDDENSGQTMGVVSELQQVVRQIFVGNFRKKGDISIRDLVRKKGGKVIFIEYDLSIGSMITPVYKLLIDLAIKEALSRTKNEGSVYFMLDEFRLLPNLEHIDNGVNFGRSLGAKFVVGIQNIDQISAEYGKDRAGSMLSGFGSKISFRVNDAESREYIKNLFGRNIKLQTYLSAVQNRGVTEEIREGYVVEDKDITSLSVGEAIIGILDTSPFKMKFKLYK